MKTFRITWYSVLEDSVLEGRSLVTSATHEEAVQQLIASKSQEYRLKPYLVNIHSIVEIQSVEQTSSNS